VQTLRDTQAQLIHAEKMSAIGQLAAGIAHDFNNIMAVITLYTSASLRIPHLSPDIQERLLAINRQAKRASNLIQQILDFSRRAVLERRPMDLVPFLREQVRLLERTLPESIKITVAYGSDDHMIFADPTRMQQVVMNLALNARDAMPEGGELHFELARIRVEDEEEPPLPEVKAGEWVRLSATDTGTGIPPDALPHIFEPFFTTKAPGKGSGLGLAQIHGIVKQHEGEIGVESQMGQGTTFHIYLPTLPVPQPEPLILEAQALVKGQGETLLVVEDNPAARKALVDSLEQLDYLVLAAENGQEALAIFEQRSQEIALVLSDVVMPELGGVALLRALRQRDPTVPVVMLTGHSMKEELDRLRAQGLNAWMPKPPSLEQLAQVVAQVLAEDPTGL
jgi:CheY-like chemotaxis protein